MSIMMFISSWIVVLIILSVNSFFLSFELPPRLLLVIGLPVIVIIYLFINKNSRGYLKELPLSTLTYLHVVRVPVELVLWWLFLENMVPELMTFNGRNYDIIAGISAPFIGYFALGKIIKSNMAALLWNILAMGSLLNIVVNAILSTPYSFQMQAFDQPNLAVFYFPFILLPGFIVPAVLFSHLASISILLKKDFGQIEPKL